MSVKLVLETAVVTVVTRTHAGRRNVLTRVEPNTGVEEASCGNATLFALMTSFCPRNSGPMQSQFQQKPNEYTPAACVAMPGTH